MIIALIIALAFGSLLFLSVILIVVALRLRNQWDRIGQPDPRSRHQ